MPANFCGVSTQGAFAVLVDDDLRPVTGRVVRPVVADALKVTDALAPVRFCVVDDRPLRCVDTVGGNDPPRVEVNAGASHATFCHLDRPGKVAGGKARQANRKQRNAGADAECGQDENNDGGSRQNGGEIQAIPFDVFDRADKMCFVRVPIARRLRLSTTAEQARVLGLKNYERSRRLPRWRWLAIRNAQNRSIFWSRAAFHLFSLEREMPKVGRCPICAAWETEK